MSLALESRLALWLLLLKEYGRRDVTSVSRPGFVTLATSTSCFLEGLLWEKPATVWEIQLLKPSHCQEAGPGYFESPHGERRAARARHSSHLKPGSRHVSEKKSHLGCGQGPRTTARTEAAKCPVQANSSPLSHRRRPQISWGWGWRGASPAVPAWFPEPRNCISKRFPFPPLSSGGSLYTATDNQRWVFSLGLAVR